MKYLYAYRFVFESPKWLANLVASTICQLVPYVGPIVFLGYGFEMMEALHRRKQSRYPDFDTNRLMPYLLRGLWPFLVQLVASLPLALILIVVFFCLAMGVVLAPDDKRPLLLGVLVPIFFLAILLLGSLFALVVIPLVLRAGLMQDFSQAFSRAFVMDFIKRVWLEVILLNLFVFATSLVLTLAGMLVFYFGAFAAAGLIAYAQIHLLHQIYELYLQRGGTPIPIKTELDEFGDEDLPSVTKAPPDSFRASEET
jgi:hypothetical protein